MTRLRLMGIVCGTSITTAALVVGGLLFLADTVLTRDTTLLRLSPCRVTVTGEPPVLARLYSVDPYDTHLLVLTSKTSGRREIYQICPTDERIGLPDWGQCRSLFNCIVVDRRALGGCPEEGEIDADWDMTKRPKEIRLRIKGYRLPRPPLSPILLQLSSFPPEPNRDSGSGQTRAETISESIALGLGREIVIQYGE